MRKLSKTVKGINGVSLVSLPRNAGLQAYAECYCFCNCPCTGCTPGGPSGQDNNSANVMYAVGPALGSAQGINNKG
jgi:hypothetical protein